MATTTQPPPRRISVINLPNQLTAARLVLAVVLFVLIALELWAWCLAVFAVAAFTDWLDGYVARLQGLYTSLGRIFDPLVDKVLICGAFICLLPFGSTNGESWLVPWMVVVVVSREFLITGLRSYLESQGVKFGADLLGKIKMTLQCAALAAIFLALMFPESVPLQWTRDVLVWGMLISTILSGLQYIIRGLMSIQGEAV